MNNLKIHIIGGTGQMGNWLKGFLESQGFLPTISGSKGNHQDLISQADIVFISVPISLATKIILETGKIVKKDCLLVDLTSVKTEASKALAKTKLSAVAIHPLFGPSVSSIQNQKIIFCLIKKSPLINKLKEILENAGGQTFEMNPVEHDNLMAHIQGLIHLVNINLAQTFIDNKIDLTGKISTPVSLNQLATLSRVLSQDSSLLTEIQLNNPQYPKILKEFIKNLELSEKLILSENKDKLKEKIEKINKHLKPQQINILIKKDIKEDSNVKFTKNNLKFAYLGPEGTFSNQATIKIIGDGNHKLLPQESIRDIFEAVTNQTSDFGVVPAENSTEGTIRETLDFLVDYDLKTLLSLDLTVHQNLLFRENNLSKINRVISHPQALAQCKSWLLKNLPNAKIERSSSTLSAVSSESHKKGLAFIGPELAAKVYNLNIVKRNIEDNPNNVTKFYLISKFLDPKLSHTQKALLFLTVFNRVGILKDILTVFANLDINLNKIESRPNREKTWDYHFFIGVDVAFDDPKLIQALNLLRQYCPTIKILGGI